ncbi:MAG: hypothetical protein HUU50_16865 [Candidatus Brocadiae bacterium]|nr:hypothetical protein [Candidatus Brocadiia bacterium]
MNRIDLPILHTEMDQVNREKYSSTTTLTAIELEVFPELAQAQWLANMMSPSLWKWEENLPKRRGGSPVRRKVEEIKQYLIHAYEFCHMEEYPGLCPSGLTDIETEDARFPDSPQKQKIFQELRNIFLHGSSTVLAELLQVNSVREYYRLMDYPKNMIPRWGNETIDKMDAYKHISRSGLGAGKCQSLALLYASALIILGRFPWQNVAVLWFSPSHVMTYLKEGEGYLASNKRIFSAVSLQNINEHTSVVKSCLEKEKLSHVQMIFGNIHDALPHYSIDRGDLDSLYLHLENYAASGNASPSNFWTSPKEKTYIPFPWPTIDFSGVQSAESLQNIVYDYARKFPGSIYDLAMYAFRCIDVKYPEIYAYTAKNRSSRIKDLGLETVEQMLEYAQNQFSWDSIFPSPDRIALPDEVILFQRGTHRDRALLLYALLANKFPHQEPFLVFTKTQSFVLWNGILLPVQPNFHETEEIFLLFNSQGSVKAPDFNTACFS